jgi:preprotein translocase subunit YajC
MNTAISLFLQSEGRHSLLLLLQNGGGPSLVFTFVPFILIFLAYQFLIAKPQRETKRAHEDMLKNLKKDDKIITTGGIYGTVREVNEKEGVVQVRIADSVVINVSRSAIAALQEPKRESKESEKK